VHHAEESALPVVGGVRGIAMLCGMGVNSAERARHRQHSDRKQHKHRHGRESKSEV